MACFTVTAAEAVVVTAAAYAVKKHEEKKAAKLANVTADALERDQKVPWSRKLRWLSWLLWGGALLLAYEHVWHGEVVPWFPFLTAMNDPEDTAEMLHEMSTVGVGMALLVTGVWAGMVCVSTLIEKNAIASSEVKK